MWENSINIPVKQSWETWKQWVWVNLFDWAWNVMRILEAVDQWHKKRGQISLVAWSLEENEDAITAWKREVEEEVWIDTENAEIIEHSWKIILNIFDDTWKLTNEVFSKAITIKLKEIKPTIIIDEEEVLDAKWVPATEMTSLLEDPKLNWEIRPWSRHAFLNPDKSVLIKLRNGKYLKE